MICREAKIGKHIFDFKKEIFLFERFKNHVLLYFFTEVWTLNQKDKKDQTKSIGESK